MAPHHHIWCCRGWLFFKLATSWHWLQPQLYVLLPESDSITCLLPKSDSFIFCFQKVTWHHPHQLAPVRFFFSFWVNRARAPKPVCHSKPHKMKKLHFNVLSLRIAIGMQKTHTGIRHVRGVLSYPSSWMPYNWWGGACIVAVFWCISGLLWWGDPEHKMPADNNWFVGWVCDSISYRLRCDDGCQYGGCYGVCFVPVLYQCFVPVSVYVVLLNECVVSGPFVVGGRCCVVWECV